MEELQKKYLNHVLIFKLILWSAKNIWYPGQRKIYRRLGELIGTFALILAAI